MQFAILKNRYSNNNDKYTIIYKEEDIYYYSFPKTRSPQIYWNNSIRNILNDSIIEMVTNFNMPNWIRDVAANNIIWLNIDKPENIPTQYPELLI